MAHARTFCENIEVPFTERTILVTGLTGASAAELNGETLHSAIYLMHMDNLIPGGTKKYWEDARLLIVDEVAYADVDMLERMDDHLKKITKCPSKPYGGLNVVFVGDFRQLEPVVHKPLHRDPHSLVWFDWLTDYIELGNYPRAKKDKVYAAIIDGFYQGTVTKDDIDLINTRVLSEGESHPSVSKYACYTNAERCGINDLLFIKHLKRTHSKDMNVSPPKHTVLIGASDLWWRSKYFHFTQFVSPRLFYETCSETDCMTTRTGGRMDPCLKLHDGCSVMSTENKDIARGQVNGSQCKVTKVVLKAHCEPDIRCVQGYYVNFVKACDVAFIELCLESDAGTLFQLKSCDRNVVVDFTRWRFDELMDKIGPMRYKLRCRQFPIRVSTASTAHKLQGDFLKTLTVTRWSYTRNWPYVILSRVQRLRDLYLCEPLRYENFGIPPTLEYMKNFFEKNKTPSAFDYQFAEQEAYDDSRALQEKCSFGSLRRKNTCK